MFFAIVTHNQRLFDMIKVPMVHSTSLVFGDSYTLLPCNEHMDSTYGTLGFERFFATVTHNQRFFDMIKIPMVHSTSLVLLTVTHFRFAMAKFC